MRVRIFEPKGSPHDAATLEQLETCAKAGNAPVAALCADGHLGYSAPIGSAVGYEDHVSPSGVGFDIGCFTGDTKVFTLDGQTPTLADLDGRDYVYVLGCTPEGTPVPAKATCRRTRIAASLVRVTLDDGSEIRCTPDHLFMLRDGSYERADALAEGRSLMPLYKTSDRDGYVLIRNNRTRRLMRLHWMVFRAGLLGPSPDLVGDELVLHHRNFTPADNDPENLLPMRKTDHDAMHAAMRDRAHFNTPEFHARRVEGIKAFWEGAREDLEFMERRRETATANIGTYMADNPDHFREAVRDNGKRGAEHLRRFNTDPETIKRNKERAGTPTPCPLCGEITVSTSSLYYHAKKHHPDELAAGVRPGRGKGGRNPVSERLVIGANNHKVVSVEALQEREDVYCLSVPGLNNFALASGVFVHNCGNKAVETDLLYADVAGDVAGLMDEIQRRISFGVGLKNAERADHPVIDKIGAASVADVAALQKLASEQLGTVGSGNHYVDLFEDRWTGRVWVGVHFGSRGFGHKVATGFLALSQDIPFDGKYREGGMMDEPTLLAVGSPLGDSYLEAMTLAGEYAYAGRDAVVDKVLEILGNRGVAQQVHNHHNYQWRETHDGRELYVVRKGSTPLFPGQLGFVGSTMGEDSVILEGRDSSTAEEALYSAPHGAGRAMSRTKAAGKWKKRWTNNARDDPKTYDTEAEALAYPGAKSARKTRVRVGGLVDYRAVREAMRRKGIEVRGGGADEAPEAYKRLPEVLAAHADALEVRHLLRPVGVCMADERTFDPYRD